MSRRQRHRRATFWTAVTVCLMAASCVMSVVNRKRDQRPQAWDAQRGPTVPHDTFPGDCALCHVSENWHTLRSDFTFDHAAQAGLELNGAHATAQCLRCHNDRGPVELFAQRGCSGCHSDPHQGELSSNCAQCHNERNWAADRQFAQHARTRFPLIGAHVGVACFRCHLGAQANNFKRADVHCVSCHRSDLERATNPDHAALSWTDNCQKCHTPVEWGSGGFVHNVFPLTGGHQVVACNACHTSGQFTGLSQSCSSCHLNEFQATTNPNHITAGFSQNCQDCHSTAGWGGAGFLHNAFPLTGGHQAVACTTCHANGQYSGFSQTCSDCHFDDFQATTNPNHLTAGFGQNCQDCHSTVAWGGAGFVHDRFPLTGAHQAATCAACHPTGQFAGTPQSCSDCHLSDFQSAANPNHVATGFSQQCQDCHSTIAWRGATFAHNRFPLTGAHETATCAACHTTGQYAGTPQACSACHLTEYQTAVNPNHAGVGFPLDCEQCHSTTTWQGATFAHQFNIASGPHRVYDCSECHRVPGSVHVVSCTHCHEHGQASAGEKHQGEPGYVWDSNACIGCHPTGRH